MKSVVSLTLLSFVIGVSAALAQTSAPPTTPQPVSASKMSADNRQAISKSCSDQANAKRLHGEARKKFRSECKQAGGKVQ
jgi:hypothetical protein